MFKSYDRFSAVEYARRWALDHNPKYYHFGGIGGDCTNYISQCLYAGGAVMNYDKFRGWYYNSITSRSPSWTGVNELGHFLLNNQGIGAFASIRPIEELELGDLIQLRQNPFRYNHTLIITKIENGQIYICAHSRDKKDVPLSSYPYLERRGIHIEGIRVIDN